MKPQTTNTAIAEKELFVYMAVSAWEIQNDRVNKLLDKLTDELWMSEIAPGKNTGIYLLGHLTAINDNLFTLFGLGKNLYPQLNDLFVKNPDKSGAVFPPLAELKKYWKEVNSKLAEHFAKMQPEDWFTRHTAVSEVDFEKEPHRNKLNVLMNRTSHQSYHLGQIVLLQK